MAGDVMAAALAQRVLRASWKTITGTKPPEDPSAPETDVVVALIWAITAGATVGVARMLVERQLATRFAAHADA